MHDRHGFVASGDSKHVAQREDAISRRQIDRFREVEVRKWRAGAVKLEHGQTRSGVGSDELRFHTAPVTEHRHRSIGVEQWTP